MLKSLWHSNSAMNSACQVKRKSRETKLFQYYERDEKYQFPASEFEIRVSNAASSQVWRFFGDLYHRGNLVCDRVYCSPCFENQRMGEGLNYYLGILMPKIKHYAKSVSTGNLAIHLHDKHNIATGGSSSSSSSGRPGRSHSRNSQIRKPTKSGNVLVLDSEDHFTSSNFARIDSSDDFDEDQEPSVIAKNIQKLALEIVSRISSTDSQSNLIHDFRALLRLSRSNFVCLIKTKCFPEAHHHYMVSMQFVWNLIKSAIVIWRGMPNRSLVTYLNAIDYAYKMVPTDLRSEEDLEQLGHVLILMSGSIKCCDQATLVLFAETID